MCINLLLRQGAVHALMVRGGRSLFSITRATVLFILLSVLGIPCAFAQSSTPNYPDAWITNGSVYAIARTEDTTYIGGNFSYVGPNTGSGVPLDIATGQPLNNFPKVMGYINTVVPDGEGGWYIGGNFTRVGPASLNNLAHIHSDGRVDLGWSSYANGEVFTLLLSGTTLYVGGGFGYINGSNRNSIAALDASTGTPTSWNPSANNLVYALALSGTTLYVGGSFSNIGGQTRNRIAAIDVSTGTATTWNPNANGWVRALAVSGSTVYAGGHFTTIGGQTRNYIAVLNTSGTGTATNWNPNANGAVYALAVSGSTLYTGGDFSNIGGQTRNRIAALDASTGMATDWNPNANEMVYALTVSGSTVYAGGGFSNIGSRTRNYISALDASTGTATDWNPNAYGGVIYGLAISDSTVYAGGRFKSIGGQERKSIAALDASTGTATVWNPNADGTVYSLAVSGSTVYTGGGFTRIGGQTRNCIAALDASTGTATDWNPNANGLVYSLAVSGSTVYTGGMFTSIGGQTRNRIAALNTSGTGTATIWNPSSNGEVYALAVSGSTVYAGGMFTNIGTQTRNRIAALNSTTGAATSWNPNADNYVRALAVSGTTVYAGGDFSKIGTQTRNYIAAINTDGTLRTWNPSASSSVYALAVVGSTVYAGGGFTSIGGQTRNRIAALSTSGTATDWNPNANSLVRAIAASNTSIHVGGDFTTIGGLDNRYYAQFGFSPAAPSNPGSDSVTTSSLRWTWTDQSTDETGFKVWSDPGWDAPQILRSTTAANTQNWQQDGLTPNTAYSFQVAATSTTGGDSARTANHTRTTLCGPPSIGNNVQCDKNTGVPYIPGTVFSFSNPAGFGPGIHGASIFKVSGFRYAWDTSPDYSFSDLLLLCDGPHQGNIFIDSSPNGFPVTSTGVVTTQDLRKSGSASGYFSSAGKYLTIPDNAAFDFDAGPFTIDMWIGFSTGVTNGITLMSKTSGGASWSFGVSSSAANRTLSFSATNNGQSVVAESAPLSWNTNTFYHVVANCSGSGDSRVLKVYRDEVEVGSVPVPIGLNLSAPGGNLVIGRASGSADPCYMDEIRIKKGPSSGSESTWNSGTLNMSPTASGNYYLHLQSLNRDNISGGTVDYGPFVYDPPVPPMALFSVNPNPADPGQSISFDASASYHPRAGRSIISYAWDFGDGLTGTGVSAIHDYATSGTYTVTLTVTDNNDPPLSDQETATVVVNQGGSHVAGDDITELMTITFSNVQFNRRNGEYSVGMTITNPLDSGRTIQGPVKVVIDEISSPTVQVLNADEPENPEDGPPYTFDLSDLIGEDGFHPGQQVMVQIVFDNSTRERFTFEKRVFGVNE